MFDDTPRDKIIQSAISLAEASSWRELSLLHIAQKAGLSLVDLRAYFSTKEAIFSAFLRKVDDEVLRQVGRGEGADAQESARDRLFDVLMTRFEVLSPYRAALRSIAKDWQPGSGLRSFYRLVGSNYWMLNAANIPVDGPLGAVRLTGAAAVYSAVLPVWLKDEEAGLPKTMAALDGRLRSAERWLNRADKICSSARSLFCCLSSRRAKGSEPAAPGEDGATGTEVSGAPGEDGSTGAAAPGATVV